MVRGNRRRRDPLRGGLVWRTPIGVRLDPLLPCRKRHDLGHPDTPPLTYVTSPPSPGGGFGGPSPWEPGWKRRTAEDCVMRPTRRAGQGVVFLVIRRPPR